MLDLTPALRIFAHRRLGRLARQHPAETQQRQLLALVNTARGTAFGRDHDFRAIRSVADFQARVPLRSYEDFWESYWKPAFPLLEDCSWPGRMPYFAVSSGTTAGRTKYIPCSREMVRANGRAALDVVAHHLAHRPASRLFGGRSFVLGGSTDLKREAPGVLSGDLSGIAAAEVPRWARPFYFPPRKLALIENWEEKIARMGPLSLRRNIRSISGTPSWLLILFDRMFQHAGGDGQPAEHRLAGLYPRLELLVHGGVGFAPYRARYEALLAGGHAELREVYPASEGFIAVQDGPSRMLEGGVSPMLRDATPPLLRLMLDNGLFHEFVPLEELGRPNPTRHWVETLETGVDYALALSSNAGLWAYLLGDTVRFVERDPPRLLMTGRTAYTLSAFGEHLTGEEVERAVADAAASIAADVSDFAVGSRFPEAPGELGGHLFVVEFAPPGSSSPEHSPPPSHPDALQAFAADLDARLCDLNDDYRAHRAGGYGLDAPRVIPMAAGGFSQWMKARGKQGGQHKVPRIVNDGDLLANLLAFAEGWRG
ncbi:MAG: GH3 auxin-responsive promoter family protein [bacterium]